MLAFSSIVLIGNFNPAIFHPEWFDRFKILPIQETQWAEGLEIEKEEVEFKGRKLTIQGAPPPPLFVTPKYTHLTFKSLTIDVREERFDCKTFIRENFSLLTEVTLKIFSLLEHTPVKAVGINFEGHWKLSSDGQIILKKMFGCKNNKPFDSFFGKSYEIGQRISTTKDDYMLTIDYRKSKILEGGVFIKANYHREVKSNRTEDALEIISQCYHRDLEEIIKTNINIFGAPKEYVTDEQQHHS